jgi:predicted nucleotidyltransferase
MRARQTNCPDPAMLDDLVKRIVEAVHPLRIILFGSAARGEMGPDSDLDVLVVMPDGTHRRNTIKYLYRRLYGFETPKDILVATESDIREQASNPGLIYRTVLQEGKEIYRADSQLRV